MGLQVSKQVLNFKIVWKVLLKQTNNELKSVKRESTIDNITPLKRIQKLISRPITTWQVANKNNKQKLYTALSTNVHCVFHRLEKSKVLLS